MIRLRPYKLSDGDYIVNWVKDEYAFKQWCMDKFSYPLTRNQLDEYYHNCEKDNNAWIMTALDEDGTPVGHFLMRMADYEQESIHLGFIIIDSDIRGKGYGKEMVLLAIKYTFDILKVKRVTLGVFDNNIAAHYCYKASGFVDEKHSEGVFEFEGEQWGTYDMVKEK